MKKGTVRFPDFLESGRSLLKADLSDHREKMTLSLLNIRASKNAPAIVTAALTASVTATPLVSVVKEKIPDMHCTLL